MLRLLATTIVATTPAVIPAPAAQARPAASTRLVLQTTVGSTAPHSVTLRCDPAGGTHPKAAQACADLVRSGGEIALPTRDAHPRACFMIFSPIRVNAQGTWQGRDLRFQSQFPNTCVLHSKTGSIFDF